MATPTPPAQKRYGKASWVEIIGLGCLVSVLPFVIVWNLVASPFVVRHKFKTWRRVLADSAIHFLASSTNVAQAQFGSKSTRRVYEEWAGHNGLPITIEELDDNARLLWIGPKRADRVVLYCHGGGYISPLPYFFAPFWRYVQLELRGRNLDVGFAILNYSLLPDATFPTQLRQAKAGLEHLLASGVQPRNLQITGDSAGGNLILQLLSHALHPLGNVPPLKLASPIRGVYLMSPWVSFTNDSDSFAVNAGNDVLSWGSLAIWGSGVLADVPMSQRAHVEAAKAPEGWFRGIDAVVDRFLVTTGSAELFRDDVTSFAQTLAKYHPEVLFTVQKHGIHDDPLLDFAIQGTKVGELTPLIIEWIAKGFAD